MKTTKILLAALFLDVPLLLAETFVFLHSFTLSQFKREISFNFSAFLRTTEFPADTTANERKIPLNSPVQTFWLVLSVVDD